MDGHYRRWIGFLLETMALFQNYIFPKGRGGKDSNI